jgi:tetratricopeptide (TPR) repeat protein
MGTDERTLVDHLHTLTRLDLVEPAAGAPTPTYEFRHVITQEVAYNLMLTEQSRELHRRLADWHERTYAADLSPFHPTLAHHWRRAGSPARSVDHLERAGEGALRTFANEEAIGFLEQAIALDQEAGLAVAPERRGRWELQLGEAHVNMSRYHEGRQHLEQGLSLLGQPVPSGVLRQSVRVVGELVRQALRRAGVIRGVRRLAPAERSELVAACRAFASLAEASYYDHDTLLPLYCVIRTLNEAEAAGSHAEIASGLAGTGALFGLIPLPGIAERYLTRAIARLDHVDDLTTHEFVEITVGFYYIGAARWDLARERFRSVRRTARRLGDRRRLDDALANETELEYLQGNLRVSLERANELVASAAARADRRYEAEGLAGRAYCAWLLGSPPVALESLERIRTIMSRETELTDELRLQYHGALALVSASRGDEAQALAATEEALRLTADTRPAYYGTFLGYVGPADVHLQLWERGSSLKDPRRAGDALARLDAFAKVFPIARPRSRLLGGRRAWLLGKHGAAIRAFESALAAAEELDMPYEAALAHMEIGRRLNGEDPARAEHLRQGRQILERIGVAQSNADA